MAGTGVNGDSVRHTHLDSLRAALMILGIVIHGGLVYITDQFWLVASEQVSRFFDYLVLAIHAFRMPAFFLLSGFLFALVLSRSQSRPFFRSRSRRILIPLFSIGLALNLLQILAFRLLGAEHDRIQLNPADCDSIADMVNGCWTIHLWFLVHLFYYFLLGWPLTRLMRRMPQVNLPGPRPLLWPVSILFLVFLGQATLSLSYRGVFDFTLYLPLVQTDGRFTDGRFYYYLPFFLFGVVLAFSRENPATWNRFGAFPLLLMTASWVLLLSLFNPDTDSVQSFLRDGRYQIWLFFAVAFQTTAFLVVISARLPRPSPRSARYLADAALTIYLVHHILIFGAALVLVHTNLPIGVQFLALIGMVSLLSWAVHHYGVNKSRLAGYLVNGRIT